MIITLVLLIIGITIIVKKRVKGKSPFFSWLIVEPDKDMVIIKMKSST